jgi:hypothetical protein
VDSEIDSTIQDGFIDHFFEYSLLVHGIQRRLPISITRRRYDLLLHIYSLYGLTQLCYNQVRLNQ